MDDERTIPEEDFLTQDGPGLFDSSLGDPAREKPSRSQTKRTQGTDEEPQPPLALYRRYRPEVFSEVIGQEHVTEPLKRALRNNRVNHAYLFSGPRGCGKTSSARILARSLNCEQGPTPDPCGVCESCRDLSRAGSGSIDVIEIDAASHGGVDDARDLRERAFFAPVRSRYKIYIVDEAHMVTQAGFNALLKLVEEPPDHVKFIFATTEPEKVIGTIRSRTHHYPFRLIPPKTLAAYLEKVCEEERVSVDPGVVPMVVRAGAGSVRDSLSVLDQLLGGASSSGVEYAQAAALLGYTPDSLLDQVLDAFAANDSTAVFSAVDKVIESGQDPRRFTEDLLRRFRDLMIVAAVPNALTSGLIDVAGDQAERLTTQARDIGVGGLTRSAEILAAGLVAMRGTTAPRLNLELMCARILLPGADAGERGIHARLDRLERRLGMGDVGAGSDSQSGSSRPRTSPAAPPPTAQPVESLPHPAPASDVPTAALSEGGRASAPLRPAPTPPPQRRAQPVVQETPSSASASPTTDAHQPPTPPPSPQSVASVGGLAVADIRQAWPQILDRVKDSRKFVWMILTQFAAVTDLVQTTLWLTFKDSGSRDNFNHANGEDEVRQAIIDHLGITLAIRARLDSEPIPTDGGTAIISLAGSPSQFPAPTTPGASTAPRAPHSTLPTPPPPPIPASSASAHGVGSPSSDVEDGPPEEELPMSAPPEPLPAQHPNVQTPGPPEASTPTSASTPSPPRRKPAQSKKPPQKPTHDDESFDAPDADTDTVMDNPSSMAEELVEEIFDAELVKEEQSVTTKRKTPSKPASSHKKSS